MKDKNKKRDPMPPPDATPEEIGEFWDTHSLADYWDETHEVEFQVNLKSRESLSPDEAEGVEQGWQKLKKLIQSVKPADFEKFAAVLLKSFLNIPFVVARSGDQPSGDARSLTGEVSIQVKNYSDRTSLNAKEIEGDIRQVNRTLQDLQVYVLVVSRDAAQLHDKFDSVSAETGLDIVTLEFSDELSDLGALCVNYWEAICHFFPLSDTNQEFSGWVEMEKDKLETKQKTEDLRLKLEEGIQTQNQVQKDAEKYLRKRFRRTEGFNPVDLSQALNRKSLESKIANWWETEGFPICCLEGEEGHGKTWLATKWINSICEKENIVTFWLDSKDWSGARSIFDLLYTCFGLIYPSYEERKISKLRNKPAKIWRKTLIILDGVNERKAIETAQRILAEYFRNDESEWRDRIRFLLTTRPLDDYPDFERYLWSECHKISVDPFNDSELQEALTLQELQPDDLPNSLKDIAKIPRYFQTCIRLRNQFRSFDAVTKEIVLWTDLLDKIERTDPQIKQKFGWHSVKDAQEILSDLAKQAKWSNIDAAPQAPAQLLEKYFPNYREVRHGLEEQRIALEAGPLQAKLNADYVILGWSLYLSNLFDCTEFSGIKNFAEGFQNTLEPIPSEDMRTEALFIALQISAVSPNPDISQDQLSQKRAALIFAWLGSHNAQITDEQLLFWAEEDTDAYVQAVEFEFEHPNSPNYEDILITPLAKIWFHKRGQIDCLASYLNKWLVPTHSVNSPENREYIIDPDGYKLPVTKYDPQIQLSAAALSILSQNPESQFLETLARCYEILGRYESLEQRNIGRLMRWGYTDTKAVLKDLCSLAQQAKNDELLLKGVYGLAANLGLVNLSSLLQRPLSKKELETRALVEQLNRRFKSSINRIRDQEKLLTEDSPAANVQGNYHGLGYLAVRTDLPDLCDEDQDEIKNVLHYISVNAELSRSPVVTFEESCIQNLIPWVAKYSPESYAELACSLTLNGLDYGHPYYRLLPIRGPILKLNDCEKITKSILGMEQRLIQWDDPSPTAAIIASLLTEILLFSASEDKLTDWFKFLASHEALRRAITFLPIPNLLRRLLPKSIMRLAQQKLEILGHLSSDNQHLSDDREKEVSELEFWSALYTYGTQTDGNATTWAFKELRIRKPDSIETFQLLRLALSNQKQFLDEILTDRQIQKHLFCKDSIKLIIPVYKGKDVPAYETLLPSLPPEIIGSFLCSPDHRDNLARWGRELLERMCSILQGDRANLNSVEELRFAVNPEVLQIWAGQNMTDFLQLTNKYLTRLSKSPQYHQALRDFTDPILCLLLRFQPDKAIQFYRLWNSESVKFIRKTYYNVPTFLAQLWKVKCCNSDEHCQFRRELLEECLNDEEIMLMTLAALAEGGEQELWNLVTKEYLESDYAKERNLGVSILPWFGTYDAIDLLERLKSNDPSWWVREHATWAYEVAQQERSCREVYQKALQTRNLFQISTAFEQIKPALSPTAQWWHKQIEDEEGLHTESQNTDTKLVALVCRSWYRWGNSSKAKRNVEVFERKLSEYCRGETLSTGPTPRIAPWWKPDAGSNGS